MVGKGKTATKDKSKMFMRLIDLRVFLNPETHREQEDLQTFFITFPLYVERDTFLSLLQGRVEGETFPSLGKLGVCELLGEWVTVDRDRQVLDTALRLLPQHLSVDDVNRIKLAVIRLHFGSRGPPRPIGLRSFVSSDRVKMSGEQFMGATISQVAHAMTQHDFELFAQVRSDGLLHKAWQGADRYEMAPYLARLADRFGDVSGWVAATILQAEGLPQQAELLCAFIKLLKELVELRNHESALQILGGLNMAPIQRLKHTWTLVPFKRRQEFDEVDELFSPVGNYAHYRELMTECELEDDVPCLPYLAVILRDIIYTFDGNPEFLQDGTLNEERLRLLSKQILRVWRFQRTPFVLEPVSESLQKIVKNMQCPLSEEELYQLSVDQQPLLAPLDDEDDDGGRVSLKEILQEPLLCNGLRKFVGDREEGVLLHLIRDIDRLEELPPMPSVVTARVQEIIQRYLMPDAQMRVPLEDEKRRALFSRMSDEEGNRFLFRDLREEVFHNLETNLLPRFLADPLYRSSRSVLKEIKDQHAYEAHTESPHADLLEKTGDITREDWDALLKNVSQLQPVKKGEVLIGHDQTLDCLYRVQTGSFLVDSKATSGVVGRAVRVEPYAIFGEMNLFRPFPSASRIVAEQTSAVQRVDVCVLKKQLLDQPERALPYLRCMGKKLSDSLAKAAIYQRKAATEVPPPSTETLNVPAPRGRKQEVQAKARLMITSREVTSRFAIPPQEELAAVYDCKISFGNVVSRPGMLYLTTRYLCYESKLLGRSSREAFPLARLESYEFNPEKYQLVIRAPDHKKHKFILSTRDMADCTVKLEELQKLPSRRRSMVPRRCRMRSLAAMGEVDEMELLAEDWDLLMASQTRGIRFSPGDVIVEQDKPYCTVWQINTGSVRVEHQTTGEPLTLAKLGPGEIFGEVSFLTGWHATCSVIAESEVEIFVVTKAILHKMLEYEKSVVVKFYFYLCSVLASRLEAVHHPQNAPAAGASRGGRTRSWHSVRARPRDPVASV